MTVAIEKMSHHVPTIQTDAILNLPCSPVASLLTIQLDTKVNLMLLGPLEREDTFQIVIILKLIIQSKFASLHDKREAAEGKIEMLYNTSRHLSQCFERSIVARFAK